MIILTHNDSFSNMDKISDFYFQADNMVVYFGFALVELSHLLILLYTWYIQRVYYSIVLFIGVKRKETFNIVCRVERNAYIF